MNYIDKPDPQTFIAHHGSWKLYSFLLRDTPANNAY